MSFAKHFVWGVTLVIGVAHSGISLASSQLVPQDLYTKSVTIFTHDNMSFVVDSEIFYGEELSESRSFMIASKKQDEQNSSMLIRFVAPQGIKCTAVLMNKSDEDLMRYVYFPSLKRVRVIPDSDKQKEVLGMGVSYEEMTQPKGIFEPVTEVLVDGQTFLKLVLIDQTKKTIFWISPNEFNLKKIQVFKEGVMQKEVLVDDIRTVFNEKVIFAWKIQDFMKQKTVSYRIKEESVSNQIDDSLFHKNRLKRCIY